MAFHSTAISIRSNNLRGLVFALTVGFVVGCNCGTSADPCADVRCGPGLVCDAATTRCVVDTSNDAGATSDCTPACTAGAPICDSGQRRCLTCTEVQGCGGGAPYCLTNGNGGRGKCVVCLNNQQCPAATPYCDPLVEPSGACAQCRNNNDCTAANTVCDPFSKACVYGTAGGAGGGAGGGSGSYGGDTVIWDSAGTTSNCSAPDGGAGTDAGAGNGCTNRECPRGHECVNDVCVLRGRTGKVQVTLRYPLEEDLDLYLVEPLVKGGTCEIFYGNTNVPSPIPLPPPFPQPCGAKGQLDLDSNAKCERREPDTKIENIIFPQNELATVGEYTVRVNYYQACHGPAVVPYEVEIRALGERRFYCGTFARGDAHGGAEGAGRVITKFQIK